MAKDEPAVKRVGLILYGESAVRIAFGKGKQEGWGWRPG